MAVILAACVEDRTESFATGAEATRSGAAQRGWVPAWLPRSARQIVLQYNLDSNERWVRFELPVEEQAKLLSQFTPVPESRVPNVRFRSAPRDDLWFESLIVQHPANDSGIHAQVYRGDRVLLFVEKQSPKIYAYIQR